MDDDPQHTGHLTDEELASKTARQVWRAACARAARRPDRDGGIGSSARGVAGADIPTGVGPG